MDIFKTFEKFGKDTPSKLLANPIVWILSIILLIGLAGNFLTELFSNGWLPSIAIALIIFFDGFENKGKYILPLALIFGFMIFLISYLPLATMPDFGIFEFIKSVPVISGIINFFYQTSTIVSVLYSKVIPSILILYIEMWLGSFIYNLFGDDD